MVFSTSNEAWTIDAAHLVQERSAELVGLLELEQRIQERLRAGKFGDSIARGLVLAGVGPRETTLRVLGLQPLEYLLEGLVAASKTRFVAMLPQHQAIGFDDFGQHGQ